MYLNLPMWCLRQCRSCEDQRLKPNEPFKVGRTDSAEIVSTVNMLTRVFVWYAAWTFNSNG